MYRVSIVYLSYMYRVCIVIISGIMAAKVVKQNADKQIIYQKTPIFLHMCIFCSTFAVAKDAYGHF